MADENTTLREDLEAAMDTAETDAPEETHFEGESAPEAKTEEKTTETEEKVSGEADGSPADGLDAAAEPTEAPPEPVSGPQPPVDWADEVKARWSELPPDVQGAIHARERHINDVLQQSADARHAVDTFQQMIQPYTPLMQAEGVSDPLVAVNGLLQTTATLAMGSQQQKAQKIAGLIQHYGVDIATLDNILAGEPVTDPEQARLDRLLDQRLAPVNQLLQRVNQAEQMSQRELAQQSEQSITAFANNPQNVHFHTVREIMADFLDIAAKNQQSMTLEQAYERACMAVPEVAQQVLAQRAQGAQAGNQQELDRRRAAASSVHGQRASGSGGGMIEEGMSIRDSLEASFNLHSNERI